jgi:ribosome recycling factor
MDLQEHKSSFEASIEHLKIDIGSIRTNRATPALLENLIVEVYGSKMPLNQLASIQAPEPKMLTVEPWDKQTIKDVEKSIQTASLGLSVASEGTFLRITIPPMTEETRRELVKVLNDKLENARGSIRGVRDKIKEEITSAEKSKEISEDERFKLIEDLDKMTREFNDKVKEVGENKEEEIKL